MVIWEYAVPHMHDIIISTCATEDPLLFFNRGRSLQTDLSIRETESTASFPLSITATCRTIRSESLPLFYSLNTFTVRSHSRDEPLSVLETFRSTIGERSFADLRYLRLDIGDISADRFEIGELAEEDLMHALKRATALVDGILRHCDVYLLVLLKSTGRATDAVDLPLCIDIRDLDVSWESNVRIAEQKALQSTSWAGRRNWAGLLKVMKDIRHFIRDGQLESWGGDQQVYLGVIKRRPSY